MKHTAKYVGEPTEITITFSRVEARLLMHLAGSLLGDPGADMKALLGSPLFHLLNEAGVESLEDQFINSARVKDAP
ncbi:MAG TPA: hypothetical protein PLN42_06590 [Anaerolineae bacterium]|nr:hypothetical protein [Anaerolineae bacterium]